MNFLASPLTVTALAYSGRLTFNPLVDSLPTPDGKSFKFESPSGSTLPSDGFTFGESRYYPVSNPIPKPNVAIAIASDSARLEVLQPFPSHFNHLNPRGFELPSATVLMRVRGKCTTDHISAAGPWLKYKGHLTNISKNLLITAINDERGEMNVALDYEHSPDEKCEDTVPNVAQRFKSRGTPWALIVDQNYGEGSAREHAALQPRFYGCNMIVARSFARIHETNLKKQGILPLWFVDETDYSRIDSGDKIETIGLARLLEGERSEIITLRVKKRNGETFKIPAKHTMSTDQLKWLQAGSALNYIRSLQYK